MANYIWNLDFLHTMEFSALFNKNNKLASNRWLLDT